MYILTSFIFPLSIGVMKHPLLSVLGGEIISKTAIKNDIESDESFYKNICSGTW